MSIENRDPAGLDYLAIGSDVGALMQAADWTQSPLGPVGDWPPSLKSAVRLVLSCRQPMFVWWGERLINLYNDSCRSLLGGKHPAALGRPASEVWSELWDVLGPRVEAALRGHAGPKNEALAIDVERQGVPEEAFITFSFSPLANDDGSNPGVVCILTDDTQRIVAARELAVLRELAAAAAEVRTPDEATARSLEVLRRAEHDLPFVLVYVQDAERRQLTLAGALGIDAGSPLAPHQIAADSLQPWPLAEVLASRRSVVVPLDEAQFDSLTADAPTRPPRQAVAVPLTHSGRAGKPGVMVVGLNPLRPVDDDYRGFIELVGAQISAAFGNAHACDEERRRAESQRESDRAQTTFLSHISREFREPLALMLGPLDDVIHAEEEVLPLRHRDALFVVQRHGQRLLKIADALFAFSRIDAGRLHPALRAVDLAAYTAELAGVFRSAIERAEMSLVVECPPLSQPAYVDREMWEKIVLNLLSNAFKYTLEGTITVALSEAPGRADLRVSDTGIGIPADEIPQLFHRFHRVEGARGRTQEGSGIGLALAHELVKLHGGSLRVESAAGVGSAFTVSIPVGPPRHSSDHSGSPTELASSSMEAGAYLTEALHWLPHEGLDDASISRCAQEADDHVLQASGASRPYILLADDNRDMRDHVQRLLAERYDVCSVADGLQALEAINERLPDLVVTEATMPNLDGVGLLLTLRRDPRTQGAPVVMLSARTGEEARAEAMAAGADDYLVKPFNARELTARVARALAFSRARQDARKEEQRRTSQLRALADAAVAVNAALAVEDSLRLVVEQARAVVGAQLGLAILQAAPPRKRVVTAVSRADGYAQGRSFDFTPEEVGRCAVVVAETNKPLRRTNSELETDPDLRATPGEEDRRLPLRGVLGAPLVARDGRNMGLIMLTDKQQGEFNESDEAILVQFAQMASVAVENGQFFKAAQEARAEAEAANRMKDQFLATLSHELRTPLNAILGWARILQMGPVDSESLQEGLETIERNSRVQSQLIEDLLDLSRIISGKLRLDVQRVVLVDVIEAALAAVAPAAEAKEIRIQRVLDPLAGPVSGDPARLQQIVWNLLSNAVKFTPSRGRIQVLLERVNSHVEISVSDNGQGIRPEFLPYVFDRFRQADASTTRRHGGLGLGLSIVRQLVEMHGGSVRAKSPGESLGATFVVALPISVAYRDAPERVDPRPAAYDDLKTPRTPLDGIKVLVVDDEPDARELVKRILMDRQAEVRTAASVVDALSVVEGFSPDILLSDIGMPDQDGYDLIRQVRARGRSGRDLPAVALTAFARAEDRRRVLLAGFQMHVAKPVDPEELIAAVATLSGRTGTP